MERRRWTAAGSLALLAISWGAIPLIVREDLPASQLVAARIWLGGIALVAIMAALGRLRFPVVHRARVAAAGVILAAHWTAFFVAIKQTTVAVALALLYLGPVTAAALAPRILGERTSRRVTFGLGLALGGTLLVVRPGAGATLAGVLAGLLAAVTVAALMLVAKPAAGTLGGLTVATWELVVAAVLLAPWAYAAAIDARAFWWQLAILGVAFTGVAGVVYWSAMRVLPVAVVGVLMYLEPASAVVWAAAVLGEIPDAAAWVGVALVVAGGALAALERADEEVIGVPAAL